VTEPLLSVVIPTLDEERSIAMLLEDLRALDVPHEVIVVDGGSRDATTAVAARLGASVIESRLGRGTQLAAGARAASAGMLCFLHADVRLHDHARRDLALLARSRPASAFAFRFQIDGRGWRYRFVEFGAHLRARLFQLPYGDQGLVVSRADYEAAGGYLDVPLMEDVALVDTLRRITTVRSLRSTLPVSARRWERDGPLTRMLHNWRIMIAYRLGASPHQLAARYLPHGEPVAPRATGTEHG
jgi:rSAM/selenodomain-associated transferase 2